MMQDELLAEIEAYIKRTGESARSVGVKAANDSGLISRLRKGRTITTKTGQKLQNYMRRPAESGSGKAGG